MAQRKERAWGARDMLFIVLIMLFGVLAAMVGVAFAAHDTRRLDLDVGVAGWSAGAADDRDDSIGEAGLEANGGRHYQAAGNWNATGHTSNGKAITGSNGTPFPTGCR